MGPSNYSFRRATPNDLPMIGRWLHVPEVIRWWGDPVEQFELISEDVELAEMATLIVSYRTICHYDAHLWPQTQSPARTDPMSGCLYWRAGHDGMRAWPNVLENPDTHAV